MLNALAISGEFINTDEHRNSTSTETTGEEGEVILGQSFERSKGTEVQDDFYQGCILCSGKAFWFLRIGNCDS